MSEINSRALNDIWAGVRTGFGQELTPAAEHILKRMFFTGAAAALAVHGGIAMTAQKLVKGSLEILEAELEATLDAKEE